MVTESEVSDAAWLDVSEELARLVEMDGRVVLCVVSWLVAVDASELVLVTVDRVVHSEVS